jgi:hypothetical protein
MWMKDSFAGLLWSSALGIPGCIGAIISMIVSVAFYFQSKNNSSLPIWAVTVVSAVVCFVLLIFVIAAYRAFQRISELLVTVDELSATTQHQSAEISLNVILAHKPVAWRHRTGPKIVYFIEQSNDVREKMLVSFHFKDDWCERLIGVGEIIHKQDDVTQVDLCFVGDAEIIHKMSQNDAAILSRVRAKYPAHSC